MKMQIASPEPTTKQQAPRVDLRRDASLSTLGKKDDSGQLHDVFESILWRIDSRCQSNETMAIGISGCTRKAGATTIAAGLALQASAQQQGRVLLIDADWQLPGLQKNFNLAESAGLYDVLSGDVAPRECEPQPVSEYLDILCRGQWREQHPTTVRHELVGELLADLKMQYSLILVDLPSATDLRSALPLARRLDGSLLVTRFEAVKQPQAQRALRRLREDGVDVWGSILNRHRQYIPQWLRNWL